MGITPAMQLSAWFIQYISIIWLLAFICSLVLHAQFPMAVIHLTGESRELKYARLDNNYVVADCRIMIIYNGYRLYKQHIGYISQKCYT